MPASSPAPQRARLVIRAGRRTNRPFAIQPVAKRTIQTTGPTHAFAEDTNNRRVSQLSEAPNESDASHELLVPFSACQPRCAVGGSQPPDDPASAFLSGLRPARPLRRWPASPLRFFAVTDAMRLCSMADRSVAAVARNLVARTRRLSNRNASRLVIGHPRGCRSAKPIRITLANDPSHQALPLRWGRHPAPTPVFRPLS
jgi:hypothetical protein